MSLLIEDLVRDRMRSGLAEAERRRQARWVRERHLAGKAATRAAEAGHGR